jgi:hypothetical protein
MKQNLVLPLLLAVLVGAIVGFLFRGQLEIRPKSPGTAILHDLSFSEFITDVASLEWHVLEDRVYDTFPPLSRNPRIARRIIAQSTLPSSEQSSFAERFQAAAEEWITSHGATLKGAQNAERISADVVADGQLITLVDLPRRFYAVDNVHGVADFGCIADSGRVTIIISIIEGN